MNKSTNLFLKELYEKGLRFIAKDLDSDDLYAYYQYPTLQPEGFYETPDDDFRPLSPYSIESFVSDNNLEHIIDPKDVTLNFVTTTEPIAIQDIIF